MTNNLNDTAPLRTRSRSASRRPLRAALGLGFGALVLAACAETKEVIGSDITGRVVDNHGQPVAGARVSLYSLLDNTHFVEGSDISSGEAYIDREAVLASDNSAASDETNADGSFELEAFANAFLAVVSKDGCVSGYAGFNAETGVLNIDTLITPDFKDGINFEIEGLVMACATPPEVGPDGNTDEAPPFEPPVEDVTCDTVTCEAAGGACEEATCVITCVAATCEAAGGECVSGECTMPSCDPTACEEAGGECTADDATCTLPACSSDEACQSGQPGSFCENPGDVALATCRPPLPGECIPPEVLDGWTGFRLTDSADTVLADASTEGAVLDNASIPEDKRVRVSGEYIGDATTAYVMVQSGGSECSNFTPRTDYARVELVDGHLATDKGEFLEVALHGGCQKVQLSTSDVVGEGDRSFIIEVGDRCAPPAHPFTAILTWDAGPGQPADLDLNVWNAAGELLFVGSKQAAWGQLEEGKGPGPEVFRSDDAAQGPFTVKVQFFSGKPRDIEAKVRIIRNVDGVLQDDSYVGIVSRPKDVTEIGVFASQ
jgi:hypothetical protein